MFYDRFKLLCDQKGVSCNKAALEIGLSNATPTKWKKTGATPVGETLDKIAAYFEVSTDYLLGKEKDVPKSMALVAPSHGMDLSPEEIEMIRKFRRLDDRGQAAVMNVLNHEYESLPGEQAGSSAKEA